MSRKDPSTNSPIAIVGMGCLFPKAGDRRRYWANIKDGVDAITEVPPTHWRPEDYFDADPKKPDLTYARRGGFLEPVEFDPAEFGIAPSALEATDSAQLLGLVAAGMALRDAGYGPEKEFDRSRVSVILGVTGTLELVVPLGARLGHPLWRKALKDSGVDAKTAEEVVARIQDGYVPWQEASFPGLLGNVVAGRIANRFNLGGTNCVVDAACASSLSAAHLATMELMTGKADMVVTGGADCFNDIFMFMCFSKTPALSPTGDAKPFDSQADGTILGEGLGMLVLKRLEDAERAGDTIYAVIKGVGSSSDGRGKAIYAPSAEGQTKALRAAYEAAGVSPSTVELVEAHGTGTSAGDAAELSALTEVYREARAQGTWCALGSVKSMIGHTKAAAGSAGLIKAALALHHKVLPPTIKVRKPQAALAGSPFYLSTEKRPWISHGHPRRAAVSALGFGGSNFHVVLEEYQPQKKAIDWNGDVQLVALSGSDASALAAAVKPWAAVSSWDEARVLAMRSRAAFRHEAAARLLLVLEKGKTDLPRLAAACLASLEARGAEESWSLPEGAYFGRGPAGKLAFLFPGQGSQYAGMGKEVVCQFPQAASAVDEADSVLADLIYPYPTFDSARKAENEKVLRATENAQPALGAVAMAYRRVLEYFGVVPDMAAGHSYGELAALSCAGAFDSTTLLSLSRERGRAMAAGDAGRGAMLAVSAELSDIEKAVAEEKLDLVLANKNAPSQGVLSGRKEEIARARELLEKRGLKCVPLPVSAAFHSPLVAPAQAEFRKALERAPFGRLTTAVYANKTAQRYPEGAAAARELLASQLASPVEFSAMVERMHEDGARLFLEVGAGARLTGLVSKILTGKPRRAAAIDASSGQRPGAVDLARALAQLSAAGHAVALSKWEDGEEGVADVTSRKKPKMSVKLTGANHRSTPRKAPAPRTAAAVAAPVAAAPASNDLSAAIRASQDAIAAFQRMQEQTAALHAKFLEGQEAALRQFQALVTGQPLPAAPAHAMAASAPRPELSTELPRRSNVDNLERSAAGRAQPTPPTGASESVGGQTSVLPVLLAIVSEKTGYPAETLNVEMDLESDLGIDSIKRVEIMSAVSERLPDAPKVKPEHLGTLRTLKQIVEFLSRGNGYRPPTEIAAPVEGGDGARPSVARSQNGDILPTLLAIVSEKTGYPAETLNVDMDLESDLGIDSIKRVEIMSAVSEKLPDAPKVKPEHLGTLRTLKQIVEFLSASERSNGVRAQPTPPAGASESVGGQDVLPVLLSIVSEKTGYPAETLNVDMDLESDLGIDSIKRVEIMSAVAEKLPDAPKVKPEHLGTLRNLKQIADFLSVASGAASEKEVIHRSPQRTSVDNSRVARLVPRPVPAPALEEMPLGLFGPVLIAGTGTALERELQSALKKRGIEARLVGMDEPAADAAGLVIVAPAVKAKSVFWSEASGLFARQAILLTQRFAGKLSLFATVSRLDGSFGFAGGDFDPVYGALAGLSKTAAREWPQIQVKALDAAPGLKDAASALVAELLARGPVEVGLSSSGRVTIALEERSEKEGEFPLEPGDVVLVTGGARGVTAEACLALAAKEKLSFVLWGRTTLEAEPAELSSCATEAQLKKALAAQGLAPKEIGRRCRQLLAAREIAENARKLEALGSRVTYRAVDVCDAAQAREALAQASAIGPIRGLIHGAGVLADKAIADKTAEQFDAVWTTKVSSLRRLLENIDLSALRALVLFSSTTARLGRSGQSDYAMANEALNKAAQRLSALLPKTRVVSIGWGPWAGGMVNESLAKVFASEGVALIGKQDGGRFLVDELSGGSGAEVVALACPGQPEAGLSPVFSREATLASWPILDSHRFGGRPVVPLALLSEMLGHAALHGSPGLRFAGFEGLRVLRGARLEGESLRIEVCAGPAKKDGGRWTVKTQARDAEGRPLASAQVVLAAALPAAPAPCLDILGQARDASSYYGGTLFHGPRMRFLTEVSALSQEGIAAASAAALAPSQWLESPWRDRWLGDPAALDAAFQAMIIWTSEFLKAPSLPVSVAAYRQFGAFPEGGCELRCAVTGRRGELVTADVEFRAAGRLVAKIEGFECAAMASLSEAFGRAGQEVSLT